MWDLKWLSPCEVILFHRNIVQEPPRIKSVLSKSSFLSKIQNAPWKIKVVQKKSLSLSSLSSHFPHHSQAADERCKETRSQPFHSWCKEAAWKLRQGSDPADCSSTSIQQVSLSSIRGIWFPAFVFRLVSAFRDKLERCHSVRKGQCYLKTDYYYNRLLLFLLLQ